MLVELVQSQVMAQGNRTWMPSSICKFEAGIHFFYMTVVLEQKDLSRNIVNV